MSDGVSNQGSLGTNGNANECIFKPSNVISEVFLSFSISLFIILKIIGLILRQINQHRNFNQQIEKINLMNANSSVSGG